MSEEEIGALPPHIKYFKCENKIENGEPGCAAHKYNYTACVTRTGRQYVLYLALYLYGLAIIYLPVQVGMPAYLF